MLAVEGQVLFGQRCGNLSIVKDLIVPGANLYQLPLSFDLCPFSGSN